jgi:hypothetical protein
MTKKDYAILADAIREAYDQCVYVSYPDKDTLKWQYMTDAIDKFVDILVSDVLPQDNPLFKKEIFLKACGYTLYDEGSDEGSIDES